MMNNTTWLWLYKMRRRLNKHDDQRDTVQSKTENSTNMTTNATRHVLYKMRQKTFDRYDDQHYKACTIQSERESF